MLSSRRHRRIYNIFINNIRSAATRRCATLQASRINHLALAKDYTPALPCTLLYAMDSKWRHSICCVVVQTENRILRLMHLYIYIFVYKSAAKTKKEKIRNVKGRKVIYVTRVVREHARELLRTICIGTKEMVLTSRRSFTTVVQMQILKVKSRSMMMNLNDSGIKKDAVMVRTRFLKSFHL